MSTRVIRVRELTRVEGEGSILLRLTKDKPARALFGIFEPPRFFEGMLRGRSYLEVPDVTARICGICPVAYQMSACQALERVLGLEVDPALRDLRRLLYCGEWISSHTLHAYLLHLPDFLGYADAMAMAQDYPEHVRRGLRLRRAGNEILRVVGGREIHPINVRVGGFYRVPTSAELEALLPELRWGRDAARESVLWLATLACPEFERDYDFLALSHPREYAVLEGRLVTSRGKDLEVRAYEQHFLEEQQPHSTALHTVGRRGETYLSGPLARFNLSFDKLCPEAREVAHTVGLTPPVRNPFKSLLVRGIEVLHSFVEALTLVEGYQPPSRPFLEARSAAGTGHGCTEAPRGSLYHSYTMDERGLITEARIVPPTSRNQAVIEADLRELGPRLADLEPPEATWLAEQAVRNYDPCISCATH